MEFIDSYFLPSLNLISSNRNYNSVDSYGILGRIYWLI